MKIGSSAAAVLVMALVAGPALAASNCSVDIEGNDAMKFNLTTIDVPKSCKDFTVNLKHVGKFPKNAMGHNWVLTKTADVAAVNRDGASAGLAKHYVKEGDARVLAFTKIIGGGETDAVKFSTSKLTAGEDYTFFCSFPGHAGLMKGKLNFK